MKSFLQLLQQKWSFLFLYSYGTAKSSSSSIPQTGSIGTNFPYVNSIYRLSKDFREMGTNQKSLFRMNNF